MIPLAPIIAGVALCAIWRARPSTLLRVVEDAAIAAPKAVAKRVTNFGKNIDIEYQARMLDRMKRRIHKQQMALRDMSPAQRAELARNEAAVFARAEELQAQREGQEAKRSRASHASSDVSADA